MKRRILALLLLCLFVGGGGMAYAEENEAFTMETLAYDAENKTLQVTGKSGAVSGKIVTLEGRAATSEEIVFRFAVNTTADGRYDFALPLAEIENGVYEVFLMSSEGEISGRVIFLDPAATTAVLPLLNSAQSAEAMLEVLNEHSADLGLDPQVYTPVAADVAEILFAGRKADGFAEAKEFYQHRDCALAAARIKNGEELQTVLEEYESAIGIDYSQEIGVCSPEALGELCTLIADQASQKAPLFETIREQRVMACVNAAQVWGALKLAVLGQGEDGEQYVDNFAVLSPDTTYYDRLVGENKENLVYQKLFQEKSSIKTIDDLRSRFESLSESVYKSLTQDTGGGSGGGGNGGGGGSSSQSGGSRVTSSASASADVVLPQTQIEFTDMEGHWASEQVKALQQKEILSGFPDGSFQPENPVTRAEFVKMLVEAFGFHGGQGAQFSDVGEEDWFAPYVWAAAENGIVSGTEEGTFLPDEGITREEAAVMIYRCISSKVNLTGEPLQFTDSSEISQYALEAVAALSGQGIISGMGNGYFEPRGVTTRAQAAVLVCSALDFTAAQK